MLREKTRVALGLDGIYSLVSTDDLADTGYTSKVRLNIQIDDLTQIKRQNDPDQKRQQDCKRSDCFFR